VGLQSCGNVDPVAVDIVSIGEYFPDMYADAELDLLTVAYILVSRYHALLDGHSAFDCIDCAVKLHQHAITHQLDHTPMKLTNGWIDKSQLVFLQVSQRCFFVFPHHAAESDNVYNQNRGKFPFSGIVRPGG
jgi:hypothetical protein